MQFEKTLDNTAWFVAPWDDDAGVCPGKLTAPPQGAKLIALPSMVQMAFPGKHGVFVYYCEFEGPAKLPARHRARLSFGEADYYAQVYLNGTLLGSHEGPDVPFAFDVTDVLLPGKSNRLAVRLINVEEVPHDGLTLYATPHRNKRMGWNAGSTLNCGGLNGHVTLSVLPEVYLTAMGTHFVADAEKECLTVDATVFNPAGIRGNASLSLSLTGDRTQGQGTVSVPFILSGSAEQPVSVTMPVSRPHLWDIDDPYLYTAALTLAQDDSAPMTLFQRVGFKTFCVKDGWFTLNGRRIYLKCSHSGSIYPVGQMLPVLPEQIRRDFVLAKAAGFNAIRIPVRWYPHCDELGLLVYEEGQGGWCLGERGASKVPGALPDILRRFDENTVGWILRDRNHACLSLVGLLNETMGDDPVYLHARDFLPQVRAIDTEHVVLLASGSWDQDPAQGRVSNPGGTEWECQWGDEGRGITRTVTDHNYWDRKENGWITDIGYAVGDIHPYVEAPMSQASENGLRALGTTPGTKPLFVSELGIGPLFNVIEEWRHFEQLKLDNIDVPNLEDVQWISSQAKKLIADWTRLGLDAHSGYPFPEWMLRESQRLSARDRLDIFDALRGNSNIAGYSLTGLNDHGWCGEGLWSQFRRMKPEVFDALEDGWSDLRFCLFVPPYVFADKPFTVEAVLSNVGVLTPGMYTADFAIGGPNGIITRFSQTFAVTANDGLSVPVVKKEITLRENSGDYTFYATLREGGAPMGRSKPFRMLNENELPRLTDTFAATGLNAAQTALLTARGATLLPFTGSETRADHPILVGDADTALTEKAIEAARNGARVVFLKSDAPKQLADNGSLTACGLPRDLTFVNYEDWLYHKECIVTDHPFLSGFSQGILPCRYFGGAFPHWIFQTDATPDEVILPAFQTGFYKPEGAYALLWAMAGFNVGKGKIYLNTTELSRPDAVPAAAKLLCGIAAALV